jgi:hypothetical protein
MSDTGYTVNNYAGTTNTTDLVDIFQPLSSSATYYADVTGYIAINGKDLNKIFQPILPFTTSGEDTIVVYEDGIEGMVDDEGKRYPFAMVTYTYASTGGASRGGTFTPLVSNVYQKLWYLACGGGGGGGASNYFNGGGGGGGGGFISGNTPSLLANNPTKITIGNGGAGAVMNGSTIASNSAAGGSTIIEENINNQYPLTNTFKGGGPGISTTSTPDGGYSYYNDTQKHLGGSGYIDGLFTTSGGGASTLSAGNSNSILHEATTSTIFYSSGDGADGYNAIKTPTPGLPPSIFTIPFFVGGGGGGGGGGNLGSANINKTSLYGLGGKGGGGNGACIKANILLGAEDGTENTGGGGGGGTSGVLSTTIYTNGGKGADGIAVFIIKL